MNHLRTVSVSSALALLAGLSLPAQAGPFLTDKPFDMTVNVNGANNPANDTLTGGIQTATVGFTTVSDQFDKGKTAGVSEVNAAYNSNSAAVIRLGYRGMPLVLQTTANSTAVNFLIPALNENLVFSAKGTRDGNIEDIREYLKSSGSDLLNRMQRELVRLSPVDPVAGNPSSMQSQMVMGDFDRNFTQVASSTGGNAGGAGQPVNNLVGIGLGVGSFSQGGLTSDSTTLPLSYTYRPDQNPGRQWSVYLPITVTNTAGAKTFGANLGVSYRLPITDAWALTPGLGYGITGSIDLGSAAAMMAASLTSQYSMKLGGYDVSIGNMAGLYQSSKLSGGSYSFDPGIRNTVFRNGVMASFPATLMGRSVAYETSYIHTLYTGTSLYSNQYHEIGLTVGTNKGGGVASSYLRAGITLLQGEKDVKGVRFNLGYWF